MITQDQLKKSATPRLFTTVEDPAQTQLAYKLKFYPKQKLNEYESQLIRSNFWTKMTKSELLAVCTEDLTHIIGSSGLVKGGQFQINWAYGNIPTQLEWDRKPDDTVIWIEFRVSAFGVHAIISLNRIHPL